MSSWSPERYLAAWNFAADAHGAQLVPGSQRPYLSHVGTVAMEILAALAARTDVEHQDLCVQCALLHDVVEDTEIEVSDIAASFGAAVAAGVSALSKRTRAGDKRAQMIDSLERIKAQPREVWMVKLADRITNLQPPPSHWDRPKIQRYLESSRLIHESLKSACPILGPRLQEKIDIYQEHC